MKTELERWLTAPRGGKETEMEERIRHAAYSRIQTLSSEHGDSLKMLDSALELLSCPEHAQDKEWYERLDVINKFVAAVSGTRDE